MPLAAELQSPVITNSIGLVLLASLVVSSNMTRRRRNLDDLLFTAMIFICAGACLCEMTTWLVNGRPEGWARIVNYVGNEYCYLATGSYAYLWVLYVDARFHQGMRRIAHWHPALLVPTVLIMLADIGSLFGNYMFVIDANNVYHRLPLSYLNYGMAIISLGYSIWLCRSLQKQRGAARFFPIAMFIIPVLIGSGIQAVALGISLAWMGVCIGLVSIHMSLQNELSYIDPLTNLYNRAYLNYALQRLEDRRARRCGVMIDLDYFKKINDAYGHSAGDRALQQVADILLECAENEGTVIRFAGDEFIMLLSTDDETAAKRIQQRVHDKAAEFNSTSAEPYELSLSLGYGTFDPAEQDTPDAFLHRIDERMYEEKRAKHAERD